MVSGGVTDTQALLEANPTLAESNDGGANLALIEAALPAFLASLQDELNAVVFTAPAPLVGDQLSDTGSPGQFLDTIAGKLTGTWLTSGSGESVEIDEVRSTLRSALRSLVENDGDLRITHTGTNNSDWVQFQLSLVSKAVTDRLDVDLALGVDPMIDPRLGIEDQVDVTAKWTFELTFGVSEAEGFFVSTAAADELTVEVTAALPDTFAAKGVVGVFGALIEADGPSTFSSIYAIDVADAGGDGKLLAANYAELRVDATITGTGTVNLDVDASFIPDFVADADREALFNLVVTADAAITYTFSQANTQPKVQAGQEPEGQFGDPVIVEFENVTLNLGKFFTEFVDPTIRKIQETLEPLKPVVDFLTDTVPVISDLSGDDVTVLDLAATVASSTGQGGLAEGIEKAKTVVTFIDGFLDLPVPFTPDIGAEYQETNIGKFKVEVEPPEWPEYLPAYEEETKDPRPKRQRDEELERDKAYLDARDGLMSAGEAEGEFFTEFDAQIQFPFLRDPTLISAMLMGDTTVDLVKFGIGFDFGFEFEYSYPILPGLLNADLGFAFEAVLQLGAGYDMFGVAALTHSLDFSDQQKLEESVDANLYRLADGFYFDDHNTQGAADGEIDATNPANPANDRPELTLSATMTAGASLGPKLGPFKAVVGVSLNFGTHIFFDLNDLPDPQNDAQFDYVHELLNQHETEVPSTPYGYDGHVRIGELQLIVAADPAGIFNYSGALTVGMDAYVKVTLKVGWFQCTLIDETWELFNAVIYDFNIYQLEDGKVLAGQRLAAPVLGSVDANGTLMLYMGEAGATSENGAPGTANLRQHTSTNRETGDSETRESFFVTCPDPVNAPNTLEVVFQAWDPESEEWVARGKQTFKNVTEIKAFGGTGDDRILVDDTVSARVDFEAGGGNDELSYAGSGEATLWGNGGNDKLLGGSGADQLDGGSGDDELLGGPGLDHLDGGDGNDRLDGQAGEDILQGLAGNDTYVWYVGTGSDQFVESAGSDHISIRGATQVIQTEVRDGTPGVIDLNDDIKVFGNGHVTVEAGGVTILVDDIESIGVAAGGGADTITLDNLGHTDVQHLSVDLSSPDEMDQADGDTVIVAGRETADDIEVWGALERQETEAGKEVVRISHTTGGTTCEAVILNSDPVRDHLRVQGYGGNDQLIVSSGGDGVRAQDLIALRLDGGAGDDVLSTVYSDAEILGGDGEDDLIVLDDINSNERAYIDLGDNHVAVAFEQDATMSDHLISYSGVEKKVTLKLENQLRTTPRVASEVRILSTIAGLVEIAGSTRNGTIDHVIIPRSHDTNGFAGELKTDTISGMGYPGTITYSGLEMLALELGLGADEVAIWGAGADATTITGNNGVDTVRLCIEEPNSLSISPFGGLTFTVEILVVEHTAAVAAAWRVEERSIWVDPPGSSVKIVDIQGADRVSFEGNGEDTLTIVDTGSESQTVTLDENTVFVQPGGQVLSFNSLTFESNPELAISSGIVESSVAVSEFPDGATVTDVEVTVDMVRADGVTHDDIRELMNNGLTLSLSLGSSEPSTFLSPLLVDRDSHSLVLTRFSAFNGISANGTWTLRLDNTTGQSIGTLSGWTLKVTDNGQDYLDDPSAAFSPVISQDGEYVYCVGPLESGESAVKVFLRDSANGHLSLVPEKKQLSDVGEPVWGLFGCSVAISGDTAIAAAPASSTEGSVARVFKRDEFGNWMWEQDLTIDLAPGEYAGFSVAISGNTAIVGVPQYGHPGSAYVFTRNESGIWSQGPVLAGDGQDSDLFGCSVAISEDTVVVGASQLAGLGSAYAFATGNWDHKQILMADSGVITDEFGCSVAVSGNTILVGETEGNTACVFERVDSVNWTPMLSLNPDAGVGVIVDHFGRSIAISGNKAVVGANNSAYIFERDNSGTWTQEQELTPDEGSYFSGMYDDFHGSVAITGELVLIGAPYESSAYVFEWKSSSGEWTRQQKLTSVGAMAFGHAVALSGNTAIIGTPAHYSSAYAIQIPAGVGASSIAVSPDDQYLYVARPGANNTISVYRREANSGNLDTVQTVAALNDLGNGASITVSPDGKHVYVTAFGEMILNYDRDAVTGKLSLAPTLEAGTYGSQRIVFDETSQHAYVFSKDFDKLEVFQRDAVTGSLTSMDPPQVFTDGIDGVEGMAAPAAMAFSPDQQYLYVAGHDDDAIAIFSRDSSGGLTYVGVVRSGQDGVGGLRGVASLVVTEDYVFAVGEDDDSLVVFERGDDGLLIFSQQLRNGRDGIAGLENPGSMAVSPDGNWLYVASAGEGDDRPGGVAWFGIQQDVLPAAPLVVGYCEIKELTVRTGSGNDRVTIRGAIQGIDLLTVGTGEGDDVVLVQSSVAGGTTSIWLGGGDDELDLRATGEGAITGLYGQEGNDTIRVWSTAGGSTTTIEGGAGDDTIRVAGDALESPVDVDGDGTSSGLLGLLGAADDTFTGPVTLEGNASQSSGDNLYFGGNGNVDTGVIFLDGVEKVRFANFFTPPVMLTDLPHAWAGGPYALQEGGSLTLDASASNPQEQTWVSVEWDVDGDGQFGDLRGLGPHDLSWSDLRSFGLDDDGEYLVAVRVETSEGYDLDTATVNITNVEPDLVISGDGVNPVDQFTSYVLHLSATDPSDDTIRLWEIDWGDGLVEELRGGSQIATHLYSYDETPGATNIHTVTARAADEDLDEGQWYLVTGSATAKVQKRKLLDGDESAFEGQAYALALNGSPVFGNPTWTINWGDGTAEDSFTGLLTTLTHTFLDDSGPSFFTVRATIHTGEGLYTATKDVTVANVDPTLKVAGRSAIDEGNLYTLYLLADDPGDDSISSWTIDWGEDPNSDSDAITISGSSKTISHRYADDGEYSITVKAVDDDWSGGEQYKATKVAWLDRTVFQFDTGRGNTRHFYTLTAQPGTWNEVAAEASLLGGYPATITSGYEAAFPSDGQEQEFLDARFFNVVQPPQRLWINHFARDNGKVVWDTAESSDYENWAEGAPESGLVAMIRQFDPPSGQPLSRWVVAVGEEEMYGIVELESIDKLVAWGNGATLVTTVANASPRVTLDGPDAVDEGSPFTLSLGVPSDPGSDKVTKYLIDWGDSPVPETVEAPDSDGFQYGQTVSHVYTDDGNYTVTLQLVDDDGTHDNDVGFTAQVVNVVPVLTILGASGVEEGSTYWLNLGSAFDPGDDSVSRYQITWGDGWMQSVISPGEITHIYRGGGARGITVDLVDEEGIYHSVATKAVTVGDLPPTIALGGADEVEVDAVYTLHLGEVTDPGQPGSPVNVVLYTVHWGDGSTNEYTQAGDVTHIYRDGDFTCTITVDLADANQIYPGAGAREVKVQEVAPEMADLGAIDFVRIEDLDLTSVRLFYKLETTHAGLLSVETLTSTSPDGALLKLYDQNPLAKAGLASLVQSSLDGESQRIDWIVSAGTTYYLAVYGTNSDFVVRMANLVEPVGTTVTVHGTDDADAFQFAATGSYAVTINGVDYHFDDTQYETFTFAGGNGDDTALMTGSAGVEVARLYPDRGTFGEDGFLVTVSEVAAIAAHGGGGADSAFIYDSAGSDVFVSHRGYTKLSGDGFALETFDFMNNYGYATTRDGGVDVAYMEDTANSDRFKFDWPESGQFFGKMYGGGLYYNRAKNFEQIVATMTDGNNSVRLFDSEGDDTFYGQKNQSRFVGTGFDVTVSGYDTLAVFASTGVDVARLEDSADDDETRARPHKIVLWGGDDADPTYEILARRFDEYHFEAKNGGYDRAKLHDSALSDRADAAGNTASLSRNDPELDLLYEVVAFEWVRLYATDNDRHDTLKKTDPLDFDLVFDPMLWEELP